MGELKAKIHNDQLKYVQVTSLIVHFLMKS